MKRQSTPQSFTPMADKAAEIEAAEAISKLFGLTLDEVTQESKRPKFVTPRFAIAYVLHRCQGMSLKAVARVIDRKTSTVTYACTQFQNWLDTVQPATSMLTRCQQVTSQVFDRCSTGNQQVSNKSARNKTPKTTKRSKKRQNKGKNLETYEQNSRNTPSLYKYRYKNSKGVVKGGAVEYTLPDRLDNPDFFRVWNEWLDHRSDMKKPHTQGMVDAQLKMMNREGAAVSIETIQLSIENGWLGLFPDKINGKSNAHIKNNKNINAGYNKGDGSAYEEKARARGAEEVGQVFSL
jgi:hypothetical protein